MSPLGFGDAARFFAAAAFGAAAFGAVCICASLCLSGGRRILGAGGGASFPPHCNSAASVCISRKEPERQRGREAERGGCTPALWLPLLRGRTGRQPCAPASSALTVQHRAQRQRDRATETDRDTPHTSTHTHTHTSTQAHTHTHTHTERERERARERETDRERETKSHRRDRAHGLVYDVKHLKALHQAAIIGRWNLQAGRQAGSQAGSQAARQAARQAGRQPGRQPDRQRVSERARERQQLPGGESSWQDQPLLLTAREMHVNYV